MHSVSACIFRQVINIDIQIQCLIQVEHCIVPLVYEDVKQVLKICYLDYLVKSDLV